MQGLSGWVRKQIGKQAAPWIEVEVGYESGQTGSHELIAAIRGLRGVAEAGITFDSAEASTGVFGGRVRPRSATGEETLHVQIEYRPEETAAEAIVDQIGRLSGVADVAVIYDSRYL